MIKFILFPILLYSPWFSWIEHLLGLPVEYNQLVRFYILDLLMHIFYIHYSNFIDFILTHSFVWIYTWRCHDVNARSEDNLGNHFFPSTIWDSESDLWTNMILPVVASLDSIDLVSLFVLRIVLFCLLSVLPYSYPIGHTEVLIAAYPSPSWLHTVPQSFFKGNAALLHSILTSQVV